MLINSEKSRWYHKWI